MKSDELQSLVNTVKKNIGEINTVLDQLEEQESAIRSTMDSSMSKESRSSIISKKLTQSQAIIKKLRNDVAKEETALDKSLIPLAPSTQSSSVKSGRAEAFHPTILASVINPNRSSIGINIDSDRDNRLVSEDGNFMNRSVQEQLIEQKFIAIDEATINEEIITERNIEIEKVRSQIIHNNMNIY